MGAPKVISLFSGAGGLDYGFEAAGFETSVAVEIDGDSCATLRANRRWRVIERDIFEVPSSELLERGSLRKGETDLVIGGPPCQPFSKAGYWARGDSMRLDDPRANTLSAFLRVVEETLPRAFLLENVEGLAYSGKAEGLDLILRRIKRINKATRSNYQPVFKVLRAVDYGVPQQRERVIMVAARDGTLFEFPAPTHRDPLAQAPLLSSVNQPPFRTAWDAIADVTPGADEDLEMRGKWAKLLPSIPEGENYLWHTDRGGGKPLFGWRRRYWSFLLKLAKDRPSWTIQAQPGPAIGPFHWNNRRLSIRELCRLQTFPDDVKISGSRVAIQRQLGNAVPSLLAEVVAREIAVQLLGKRRTRTPPRLMPPRRSPVPPAERVQAVPREFFKLMGEHAPHPGTGLGNAAVLRVGDAAF
ncbi:MAG TPA: DNA cytosine methyltransferase [Polyangiaceae bacterium]|nr:DNA cytosine methyltransferase [Polyangiaceae bacterium]